MTSHSVEHDLMQEALGVVELFTPRFTYDANGNVEYLGLAEPGTADDTPGWMIRKIVYDAQQRPVAIKFADGSAEFGRVWSACTSYTYL